jgi:iron complex transport system substrate-binding protein
MKSLNLKYLLTAVLLIAGLLVSGCVDRKPPQTPELKRIVSMSPNLTEIVFALGAGNLLVGVDQYSIYPPQAKSLPQMGSYLDPSIEQIVAARPDLVLVVDTDENLKDTLTNAGLKFEAFKNDTFADIIDSIEKLGSLLNKTELAGQITDRIVWARAYVEASLQGHQRVRVVLVAGRNPGRLQDIYVAGSSSFIGEIISYAGGDNVFGELSLPWPEVGVEAIVGADPDIIIDATLSKGASDADFEALRHDWDSLPSLRAVKDDRIITPRDGWWQIPGSNIDSAILLIAHWLHPDIFPDEPPNPYWSMEEADE